MKRYICSYTVTSIGIYQITNVVFTKYGMTRKIKRFGQAGMEAVLKEMLQLHNSNVLDPCKPKSLTSESRVVGLTYLMFLKKKMDGIIKFRGCCDVRKQCSYMTKECIRSPMVTLEALIMSYVVDTM